MQQVTIIAEMAPDTEGGPCGCIVEHVTRFEDFTGLVLGFRRDPECVRLEWKDLEPPDEALLESGHCPWNHCPWNQSNDLDEVLWEAQAREAGCADARRAAVVQPYLGEVA